MKRKLLIILAMLLALLTGCGGSSTSDSGSEETVADSASDTATGENTSSQDGEKVFTVAMDYMPEKLHSQFGTDSITVITTPIYDPLFWDTKDGIEWRLADDIEVSDDGLVYTVKLNQDATWSDGEDITSEDILFSVKFADERSGGSSDLSSSRVNDEPIEATAIDDYTVEFKLPIQNNYFHVSLGSMNVVPAHPFNGDAKEAVEGDYFITPGIATSGAFEVAEVNADSLVYTARDDYYGGKPNCDKVIMKLLGQGAARNVAFESGELSYYRLTNAQELEKYKGSPDQYNIFNFPEGRLNYLQINPHAPNLQGLSDDARTAIFMALNQQEIIDAVYGSDELASIANSIIVPECYDYNPDNPFYDNDLEEAQRLADESGLTGKTLTYIYNKDRAGMEEVSVVVQQQLAQIGVNVQIEALDSPTFFPRFFLAWDDNAEEQATWDLGTNGWDSQRGTRNYSFSYLSQPEKWGWSEETAKLAHEYNAEPDLEKRKELGIELQAKATEESWLYPLPYTNFVCVSHKNVTGLDATHVVPEFGNYQAITVE